jgi:hypothetical protein
VLNGVTTVCHHNPREQPVFERNFPVRVVKQFGWAHSLEFSPDVAERFRATPPDWPFILHLGEGVDGNARREIFRLDELGALDRRTVLVHAVALGARGLRLAKERGAALIWCPSSNLFLLGCTLNGALSCGIGTRLGSVDMGIPSLARSDGFGGAVSGLGMLSSSLRRFHIADRLLPLRDQLLYTTTLEIRRRSGKTAPCGRGSSGTADAES